MTFDRMRHGDRRVVQIMLSHSQIPFEVEYRNDRKPWTTIINRPSVENPGTLTGPYPKCETVVWLTETAGVGYTIGLLFDKNDKLISIGSWV